MLFNHSINVGSKLLGYVFEVQYKPGPNNKVADALSRMPPLVHIANQIVPALIDLQIVKQEVHSDPKLVAVIQPADYFCIIFYSNGCIIFAKFIYFFFFTMDRSSILEPFYLYGYTKNKLFWHNIKQLF